MKKFHVTLILAALAVPAASKDPQVVHVRDPFEKCEKVTEDTRYGLTSLRCNEDISPQEATLLLTFDLGRWSAPYSRFTVLGGREMETVGVPSASVASCRRGCTFYQVESIRIPFDVLFSRDALTQGLRIKASGGPADRFLDLSAFRIQGFRAGLIKAGFIEDDGNPAAWTRDFKWPTQDKQASDAPDGE